MHSKTVIIEAVGGPELLKLVESEVGDPGPGEVQVRVGAVGSAMRSRMAFSAVIAISRQGWWTVVRGTATSVAYRTSSNPTTRIWRGTRIPMRSKVWISMAAV